MYSYKIEINNLNEYINYIFTLKNSENCELWYRGHRNSEWKLRPTLFREAVKKQYNDGMVHPIEYINYIDFVPEIENFRDKIKGKIGKTKLNLFHYTFIGQHYGLKTPILDWSTDPLVALFFALYEFNIAEDTFPLVYVLRPSILNKNSAIVYTEGDEEIEEPFNIDNINDEQFKEWFKNLNNTPFSMVPFAVKSEIDLRSHRISRQSGVFTLHEARFDSGVNWISKEDNDGTKIGFAIKINPNSVGLIINQLEALNITYETIYGKEVTEIQAYATEVLKKSERIL